MKGLQMTSKVWKNGLMRQIDGMTIFRIMM